MNKPNRICVICNKPFYAVPARINAKCCSFICSGLYRTKFFIGEDSPKWLGGKREKSCETCGKTFYVKKFRIITQKYCSIKCHAATKKVFTTRFCEYCHKEFYPDKDSVKHCSRQCYVNNSTGENAPRWMGGKSFEPYPTTFNQKFKGTIRARDNFTCAVCNKYGKSVHHINYVKDDTTPENCITLCQSCHIKTNSNRDYWMQYFSSR